MNVVKTGSLKQTIKRFELTGIVRKSRTSGYNKGVERNAVSTASTLQPVSEKSGISTLAFLQYMKDSVLKLIMPSKNATSEEIFKQQKAAFLEQMMKRFARYDGSNKAVIDEYIANMYESAKTDNITIRNEILKALRTNCKQNSLKEIQETKRLFERVDSEKSVKDFVQKSINNDIHINTAEEFNQILDNVPVQKAAIFFNNVKRILSTSAGEERLQALRSELENPFFVPKHVVKQSKVFYGSYDTNFVQKMLNIIENQINKFKYRHLDDKDVIPVKKTSTAVPKLSVSNYKAYLTYQVDSIIKKVLTPKTYSRQYEQYVKNATGARLKMLPDILEAIANEQKNNRIAGCPSRINNSYALVLYKKTNVKNRKLIRYMLKHTDERGVKTFGIRDIIHTIDNVEAEIAKQRMINQDFRFQDSKKVYQNKYDELFQKYGSLKRS